MKKLLSIVAAAVIMACCVSIVSAEPTAVEALKLAPVQKDVNYDRPSAEEAAKATIQKAEGSAGWQVFDGEGRFLRRFLDTNGDNRLDRWCYYHEGVEVYRDIDTDFNGKADQYRWLGTAGLRSGLDKDEDGRIDEWSMISAEEATAEVVEAIRNRDAKRFERLLLTSREMNELGMGGEQIDDLQSRIEKAKASFAEVARRQEVIKTDTQWIHFGGLQPGVVPSGTGGSTKDVIVYDNVAAMISTNGKHEQVVVGTLVKSGESWRVVDLPSGIIEGDAPTGIGLLRLTHLTRRTDEGASGLEGMSKKLEGYIRDFSEVDRKLIAAKSSERPLLHAKRADILADIIAEMKGKERTDWIKQFADTISVAVQSNEYPGGVAALEKMSQTLAKDSGSKNETAYVDFRLMTAEYAKSLESPSADYAKIQDKWLGDLKSFVAKYPRADDSADAMLQLGLGEELNGNETAAKKWYAKIATDFQETPIANKAKGAYARLQSDGKPLSLSGKTVDGRSFSLSAYRGKSAVLVHFWTTWCDLCKDDMKVYRQLQAKYARQGFTIVGVNVDEDRAKVDAFLKENRLSWSQLYEEGGMESDIATQFGVLTVPTTFLLDKSGKVVGRNLPTGDLDEELGDLLKK